MLKANQTTIDELKASLIAMLDTMQLKHGVPSKMWRDVILLHRIATTLYEQQPDYFPSEIIIDQFAEEFSLSSNSGEATVNCLHFDDDELIDFDAIFDQSLGKKRMTTTD